MNKSRKKEDKKEALGRYKEKHTIQKQQNKTKSLEGIRLQKVKDKIEEIDNIEIVDIKNPEQKDEQLDEITPRAKDIENDKIKEIPEVKVIASTIEEEEIKVVGLETNILNEDLNHEVNLEDETNENVLPLDKTSENLTNKPTIDSKVEILQKSITLEEAIRKTDDVQSIFLMLFNSHISTGITARIRGDYSKNSLKFDAKRNLLIKFPDLSEERFDSIWKKLENTFENEADENILYCFYSKPMQNEIYKVHKKKILREIKRRLKKLEGTEKKELYLFLKLRENGNSFSYDSDGFKKFFNWFQMIYDKKPLPIEKILMRVGIGYGSQWVTSPSRRENVKNKGIYYQLFEEVIDYVFNFLKYMNSLDFSRDLQKYLKRFDIEANNENIFQYIALEFILEKNICSYDNRLGDFLERIHPKGQEMLLEHRRIIRKGIINPFIKELLMKTITEINRKYLEKFAWLESSFQKENLQSWSEYNEGGKEISVVIDGELYYIEIHPWYNEKLLRNTEKNKILIFLYHPNYTYLVESFYNEYRMTGVIAFGNEKKVLLIGFPEKVFNAFSPFIQKLEQRKLSVIRRKIPLEVVEKKTSIISKSSVESKIPVRENTRTLTELNRSTEEKNPSIDRSESFSPSLGPTPSSNEGEDFFNHLFLTKKGFPRNLEPDNSYVVLIEKQNGREISSTIRVLIKKLYRNIMGGKPNSDKFDDGDLEELQFFDDLKPGGRLIFIKKTPKIFRKKFFKELDTNFSSVAGFTLIEVSKKEMKKFHSMLLEKTLIKEGQIISFHPIDLELNLKLMEEITFLDCIDEESCSLNIQLKNKLRNIASALWGFLEPKFNTGETLDDFFLSCRDIFDNFRESIKTKGTINIEGQKIDSRLLVRESPAVKFNSGKESSFHYFLKTLIVKYFYEIQKYEKGTVKTEDETTLYSETQGAIIPDIELIGKNEVYEVETLYGHRDPMFKIINTVEKYIHYQSYKINIILSPFDIFFYFKDLKRLKSQLSERYGIDLQIKTFDLKNNINLISLNEYREKLMKY